MELAGLGCELELLRPPLTITGHILRFAVTLPLLGNLSLPAHLSVAFASGTSGHYDTSGAWRQFYRFKAQPCFRESASGSLCIWHCHKYQRCGCQQRRCEC